MKPALQIWALAAAAATILAACGRFGNAPGDPLSAVPQARARAVASQTPSASPSPPPGIVLSTLPILTDTSTASTGVFLGAACGPGAALTCLNAESTLRHTIALGEVFVPWSLDLSTYIADEHLATWSAQGIVPEITWMPYPINGVNVTYAAIAAGAYDAFLQKSAQELRAYGYPIFLRPFHEFNGNWFPWGLANQGASASSDAAFVAAWRHMRTIFASENATNVRFVWCFASQALPSSTLDTWNNAANAYPGDAYVDWVGFDGYNRGSISGTQRWRTFDQTIGSAYALAVSISSNKPIIISEIASNEYGDGGMMKAQWISQMLSELAASGSSNLYPNLRAFVWFEQDPSPYSFDSESTQPAYNAFVGGIRTVQPTGILAFRGNGNALATVTTP
jgi:hypothetical protein